MVDSCTVDSRPLLATRTIEDGIGWNFEVIASIVVVIDRGKLACGDKRN